MASIDSLPLNVQDQNLAGGAAFKLSKPAAYSLDWQTPSGAICRMLRQKMWVTVEKSNVLNKADLLQEAYEDAQKLLDVAAVEHRVFNALPSAHTEHILWLRDNGKVLLRLASSVSVPMNVDSSVTITDANGVKLNPPASHPATWNEAMRYFRYSRIRDDVYVSYRDAYLALESIFSQLYPIITKPREKEHEWLERGCRDLEQQGFNFATYLKNPQSGADQAAAFVAYVYTANRTAVFHAKHTRTHFVPGNLADRATVTEALERLSNFLLELLHKKFAQGRSFPVLTVGFFQRQINGFMKDLILAVSEDPTPENVTDVAVSPKGLPVTDLHTVYEGVVDALGYEHSFLGSIAVPSMQSDQVGTIASHNLSGDLITRGRVEELNLSSVDDFEFRLLWQFSQRADLRTNFAL
jgi:hypothetical protein